MPRPHDGSPFRSLVPELRTDRLRLRPWRPSDAEPHRELWVERDRRSLRLIDRDGRPTVADLRHRIEHGSDDTRAGLGPYAVERLDGADFIGWCGLVIGRASVAEPELAFELARRVHGAGYATEAARAVVAEAEATGRRRLWATVWQWNTASLRVLEKVGFRDSGRVTHHPERGDTVWLTLALGTDR